MDVLWYVRKASLWRTVVWSLRTRRQPSRLVVCPDVHIGLSRNAQLTGDGTLHLGRRWDLGRFRQSELNLVGDAVLEVKGYVKIFTGFGISVNPGARLTLGSGFINTGARIDCFEEISIGDHVAIAPGVVIRDSDNHQIRDEAPVSAPIRIGNHVWIGLNAVILKGVTVNDGAVVAAGAVVTRDVPARALVGGVPARIIRENVEWR